MAHYNFISILLIAWWPLPIRSDASMMMANCLVSLVPLHISFLIQIELNNWKSLWQNKNLILCYDRCLAVHRAYTPVLLILVVVEPNRTKPNTFQLMKEATWASLSHICRQIDPIIAIIALFNSENWSTINRTRQLLANLMHK